MLRRVGRMVVVQLIGNDIEGSGRGLLSGT